MKLIDEWKWVVSQAWSQRLMYVSALLSGVEVLLQFTAPRYPSGLFAAAAGAVTVAASVARVVAQKRS